MSRTTFSVRVLGALILLAACLSPIAVAPAYAHGHTEVGDYEIVIGFHVEPAFQGDANGAEFFVTNTKTNEPVKDLEETLKMEIIYGASKRELPVEAQWGQDGAYIGYVIPTETGDYTIHIFGKIEDTPVDVTMTSSPDTFSSIAAKSDMAFPRTDPTAAELKAQVSAAAQSAQIALIVGIVGAVLGVVGIGVGVMGMRAKKA
jgi:hypothetical protein